MVRDLVGEDREGGSREPGGPVGMTAGSTILHQCEPPFELWAAVASFEPREALEPVCDRRKTVQARSALSCALVREEADDAGGFHDAAGRSREHEDPARAEAGADRLGSGSGERELVGLARRDPG